MPSGNLASLCPCPTVRNRPSKPDSSLRDLHSKACVKRPALNLVFNSLGASHDGIHLLDDSEMLSTPSDSVPVMTSSGSGLEGNRQL